MAKRGKSPKPGDRIMIFKERWLNLILKKRKTLEIRSRALKEGPYWLGCKGIIRGKAVFAAPKLIRDKDDWASLRGKHCVDADELPYKKTWALPILSARAVEHKRYKHPQGAIGIVLFRPPEE